MYGQAPGMQKFSYPKFPRQSVDSGRDLNVSLPDPLPGSFVARHPVAGLYFVGS
jgi:hypothetical protein